ncbi:MAG: ATP-binding protein [Nanoarchaeota archaeon]|nr:ATP-binding protein [Nanoarchaeota archaeon]
MKVENLLEWNPWWEKKEKISLFVGKPRIKYELLLDSVNLKEVTIITGIRRSGKSTLMYQMIKNLLDNDVSSKQILFINLEDKALSDFSLDEIYSFYRMEINPDKKAFVFFDEIHKRKDWELWIRKKYDQKTNDKFVISGSSSYLLKKEYSTLLTGRNMTFEVFPLSFSEFLDFGDEEIKKENIKTGIVGDITRNLILKKMKDYFRIGGFPEIIEKQEEFKVKLLKQYFDDILFKDIIDRYNLTSKKVEDLALYLMTNFTSKISLRNLRGALQISYDTAKDYLSYFKEAFLFFEINHFSYSLKEQKSSAPKIFCIDNGLRNSVSFKFSEDMGKQAENLVFIELKRRESEIYYWENSKHHEVDFIIKEKNNFLSAINVCFSDDIDNREIRSLLEFKEQFSKAGELIILTQNLEKKEKGIKFIPLWKWLLEK